MKWVRERQFPRQLSRAERKAGLPPTIPSPLAERASSDWTPLRGGWRFPRCGYVAEPLREPYATAWDKLTAAALAYVLRRAPVARRAQDEVSLPHSVRTVPAEAR